MSFTIALAGKGGSGKTTVASLIIRYLKNLNSGAILAVDADANANLGEGLGITPRKTVGSVLADFQGEKIKIPSGMTKESYLEFKLNEIIEETRGLDLLSMGRGEGADCYCYPNTVLRKFIDNLAENYKFVVMDNEAGMEHLSRGTTRDVDELLLVSNPTVKGVRTIARIQDLIKELKLVVKRQWVVINFAPSPLDPQLVSEMQKLNIEPAAIIPDDDIIYRFDLERKSLLELPENCASVQKIAGLMENMLNKNKTTVLERK